MRRLFLVALIGLAAVAWAGPMRPPRGTLMVCGGSAGTPPCANGATQVDCSGTTTVETKFVETAGSVTAWCQANVGAGTAPTLSVEGSIDDGATWLGITTVATPAATNTRIPGTAPIVQPIGRYRVKVTACGTAPFTVVCAEERAVGQSW